MSKDINDMMNKMLDKVNALGKQASDMVQKGANKVQEATDKAKKVADTRKLFMENIVPSLRDMCIATDCYNEASLLDDILDIDKNELKLIDDVLVKSFGDVDDTCAIKHGLDALLRAVKIVEREASMNNFMATGTDVLAVFDIIAGDPMIEIRHKDDVNLDEESANDESNEDEKVDEKKTDDEAKSNNDEAESVSDPDFESLAASLQSDLKDALSEAMQDPTFKKMVAMFKNEAEKDGKKED